jgi:hypothetical protein
MESVELTREIGIFIELFDARDKLRSITARLGQGSADLALDMFELYAMMTALKIRRGANSNAEQFEAKIAQDGRIRVSELLHFCPDLNGQSQRMEAISKRLRGRARLIPLAELAYFAAETGDYEYARFYSLQARKYNPRAWELYELCVADGLVALFDGNSALATECLKNSAQACQEGEQSQLQSSIRAPLLLLAQRLLTSGERIEVVRHLLECQNIWRHLRKQFESWIVIIESGRDPQFNGAGLIMEMQQFPYRLRAQWMSAWSMFESGGC